MIAGAEFEIDVAVRSGCRPGMARSGALRPATAARMQQDRSVVAGQNESKMVVELTGSGIWQAQLRSAALGGKHRRFPVDAARIDAFAAMITR